MAQRFPNNVFNHITSAAVFCHGSCPGISISPVYYNDSGAPNLQGATNAKLHDEDGVCVAATAVELAPGQAWAGDAADVVKAAGRRTAGPLPTTPPPETKRTVEGGNEKSSCLRNDQQGRRS